MNWNWKNGIDPFSLQQMRSVPGGLFFMYDLTTADEAWGFMYGLTTADEAWGVYV